MQCGRPVQTAWSRRRGARAFEPAVTRLASKVLPGMEFLVIAQQTGSTTRFVLTAG